jgi:hypothetical protein
MRLHTSLTWLELRNALQRAKDRGHVSGHVVFAVDTRHKSSTHERAFEIQLGSYDNYLPPGTVDQYGKRMRVRRVRMHPGRDQEEHYYRYAATWHEWGWFIREVFELDPDSRWGADKSKTTHRGLWGYSDLADFNEQTRNQFANLGDQNAER